MYAPCLSPFSAMLIALYSITEPAMPLVVRELGVVELRLRVDRSRRGSCGAGRACARPRASRRPSGRRARTASASGLSGSMSPRASSRSSAKPSSTRGEVGELADHRRARAERRDRLRRRSSTRWMRRLRRRTGSMPMSASRISPVRGSTWRRADAAERRPRRGHPADRRVARVDRVPVGVVGLDLRLHRVLEADALERLVPFEHAGDHGRRGSAPECCGRARRRSAASAPTAPPPGPSSPAASG